MRHFIWAIFSIMMVNAAQAQNQDYFFKVPPSAIEGAIPTWAQLMYSENPNLEEVNKAYDRYYSQHEFKKNVHVQNYKYWLKNIQSYLDDEGFIVMPSAEQQAAKYARLQSQRASHKNLTGTWENIGPFNTYKNDGSLELRPTQTNVSAIAVAPSNKDIMYCGADTGGGIFKSIDHGMSWFLVSADYPITNAADLKVHPQNPDIIYVGHGNHIYQSVDGGVTWVLLLDVGNRVQQFYIHRTQPNIVFAATSNGLLKSTDNGSTWENIFSDHCWDIEAHTINPDILFIAVHNASLRRAQIYKSFDNGDTWELKDNNWYVPSDFNNASDIGCKIGLTPADPDRVYAGLIGASKANDNGWIGIYYSLDGGDSWVNPDGIDGGPYVGGSDMNTNWFFAGYSSGYHQGWYNYDLDVSHNDPDRLWVGTIWACESGNRGANIEYIRGTRSLEMHADIQDIDVVGDEIWYTSDGGINYSNDEMQTVEIRNTGISASTYWGFSHGWNEDTWTGGRYHNGNAAYHENYGVGETVFLGGAETATGYINPLDNRTMHFSDIGDKKITDRLDQATSNIPNLGLYPNEAYTDLNSSEIEYHPTYSNQLYLGNGNSFYRSTNGGLKFDPLYSFAEDARVLEFEISRLNPQIIYCLVIHNNVGTIHRSEDGGHNFTPTNVVPSNNISRLDLTMDPNTTDHLWVISYYGANGQKVFSTEDGGQSWINKSTNMLDGHRMLDVLYQAGTDDVVYLATDYGVFYYDNAVQDWVLYADGLPFLTTALIFKPFYRDSKLRLSTARGIWEAPFAVPSEPIAEPMTADPAVYCSRDTIQFDDHSFLDHDGASWLWAFEPEPSYISSRTARNPRVAFQEQGSYHVTLSITDGQGRTSSKTIENVLVLQDQCIPDAFAGNALKCEANPDHVAIPSLDITTQNISMSAWVKPDGIQGEYTGIVMNEGTTAGLNFRPNNELAYHWPDGAWWWGSGLIVEPDVWSHVALVADSTGITVYLNGVAAKHSFNVPAVEFGAMRIGSYKGWGSRNFVGELDEVSIWNKSLSEEEIRGLRHLTRTGEQAYNEDLVAYYQFNADTDANVLDKIGTRHGSLSGNANKIVSTAPIGNGVSASYMLDGSSNYQFANSETSLAIADVGLSGTMVVSRLTTLPDSLPNANPHTGNHWIVNYYGVEDFPLLASIILSTTDGEAIGNAENAELFIRPENAYLNEWEAVCTASELTDGKYHYENDCGVEQAVQLFIQSVDDLPIKKDYAYGSMNVHICEGESIFLGGAMQSEAGIYYDTLAISEVLDSIIASTLVIDLTSEGIDVRTACGSFEWIDGNVYDESIADVSIHLEGAAANGCDSIVTLDLTILQASEGIDAISACQSYTWIDGNEYTEDNNTATFILEGQAINGCDSIVNLALDIQEMALGIDVITSCEPITWIDGNSYTASNSEANFLLEGGATNGCDSLVSLDFTLLASAAGVDVIQACESYTWIDGQTYTESNESSTYLLEAAAENGCDSLVSLHLEILAPQTLTDVIEACGTYTWIDGNEYTSSNNTALFIEENAADNGCDLIHALDLTILEAAIGEDFVQSCEPITWIDGEVYTESNNSASYLLAGAASNGCDSLVNLNLEIYEEAIGTEIVSACESYEWIDGNIYDENNNSASVVLVGASSTGCDSTVFLDLTILESSEGVDLVEACEPYTWIDGIEYTENNNTASFVLEGAAENGCDSIAYLDLTFILDGLDLLIGNGSLTISGAEESTYQWVDCDDDFSYIVGETEATYEPTESGTYAVLVTLEDCTLMSGCVTVVISDTEDSNQFGDINIYPNPFTDQLYMSIPGHGGKLSLYQVSTLGKIIRPINYVVEANTLRFGLDGPAGVYYLKVQNEQGESKILKLVKI